MSDEEFSELVRLQRLLAMAGIGSRRHCEDYITSGRVTVDGKTVTELGAKVNPEEQDVRLDGERVKVARKSYYMLNKPTGVLCTNQDPEGRLRVTDLFPRSSERLFTVGRLDENSEGLLLVTNDGDLAHRMAHPKFRVEKIYRVQVAGVPSREIVEQLQEGMYFSDGRFAAKSAKLIKAKGHSALLEIVLTEGQNREIRRLLAKVGHKVQRLTRVGLGPLRLGELPVGEHRRLAGEEIHKLHDLASGRTERRKKSSGKPGGKPGRRPTRGAATGRNRTGGGGRPVRGTRSGKRVDRKPGAARSAAADIQRPARADEGAFFVVRKGFQRTPESDAETLKPRPRLRQGDESEAAESRGTRSTARSGKPASGPRKPAARGKPVGGRRSDDGQPAAPERPGTRGRPAEKRMSTGNPATGRKKRNGRRDEGDDDLPEA